MNYHLLTSVIASTTIPTKMGYPERPPDDGNEKLPNSLNINFHPPTSEDSDNNDVAGTENSPYSGYEQLTFDGESYNVGVPDPSEDEEEEELTDPIADPQPVITAAVDYPADFAEIECAGGSNGFPDVVPVDLEIAQEIWNAAPQPERANAIELDDQRTNQIMTLMSGISLPSTAIPEWAQNLSEDKWKNDLLEKIRRNK